MSDSNERIINYHALADGLAQVGSPQFETTIGT